MYNGELYVGGLFTTAGGISANRIARWNGSAWNTVGSGPNNGVNGSVLALTVYGGELYVGGSFTTAGGISANRIARWNGSAWNTVGTSPNDGVSGGSNPIISDFLIFGGRLYVGGRFTTAGGNSANNIAWWDGTTWSAVGSGSNNGVSGGSSPSVNALAVYGGDLYVGGSFTTAGGTPVNNIARWNGSAWSAVGTSPNDGVSGGILALASYNGELYAGGLFTTAGGNPANSIARWNGSAWNAVGSGSNNGVGGSLPLVNTLSEHYGELYVGGIFSTAGGVPANNIARWNGSAWNAVGSGGGNGTGGGSISGNVSCSVVYGDHLFFGGDFTLVNIGGSPVASSRIARWTVSSGADAGDAYTISGDGSHSFLTTGVRIVFLGVSGEGVCAVRRFDSPASNVSFSSPPANQSQYRFVITTSGFTVSNAILRFIGTQIPNAGIGNPQTVVVYRRPNVGIGTFTALPNAFNSSFPNEVRATTNAFGEFVLGSNDLANPLPVELAEFSARRTDGGVLLAWRTASELNNAGFEVQRKLANASDWLTLGFVKGHGTSSSPKSYSFLDKTAVGAVQYRLKQIDLDGRFNFSNSIELDAGLPKTFVLEQNYPNPFNPTTTIAYQLPVASAVTLKVYDALGKEVATLVNARQEAGAYQVVLNAGAWSSGAYFYRLRAGAFVQTRKMMLLK
ncbi:MAG: T9SS type A sorting domain-containing protein [Chloroherpetonaceae bacterium]|nr:T9SS type A sorting domain-containing protein [Chloroherpetonaceae bacterium]